LKETFKNLTRNILKPNKKHLKLNKKHLKLNKKQLCQQITTIQVLLLHVKVHFKSLQTVKEVSLEVSTVKSNRDWDWDFLRHQDLLFLTVETFLNGKTNYFKLSRLKLSFETMSKIETLGYRDCCDLAFETVKNFSKVETYFFKLSRFKLSIETMSKIKTSGYQNCWDFAFETVKNFWLSRQIETPKLIKKSCLICLSIHTHHVELEQ
jgi:hypothetical protein